MIRWTSCHNQGIFAQILMNFSVKDVIFDEY